jgi:predicted exporter
MSRARRLASLGIGAALIALAAAVVALRFEVTTSIVHFLPEGADPRLARLSRAMADSELTRTIVLTLGGPDEPTAARAAGELAARLRRDRAVAWVAGAVGSGQEVERAVYELYFPRRLYFLSDRPAAELPGRLSDEGLARAARELRRQLALPTAPLLRRLAPEDPLLAFPAILDRLERARAGGLEVRDGQLVTPGGRGVVFLAGRGGAFHTPTQRALQAAIARAFDEVDRAHGGAIDLAQSGAGRFAIASEAAIKADIARISIPSTLGVVLLFLLVYRSPRSMLLSFVPLAAGTIGATAVGLLLFGRLHGLTLAFGATLLGVCVDYPIHLLTHHALAADPAGPSATLRRIRPALLVGSLTTAAGLAALAWTSLPGLREIAVFTTLGVLLSLGATMLLLPPLMPTRVAPPPAPLRRLAAALDGLLARLRRSRVALGVLPAAALVLCLVRLPWVRWDDDLSALQDLDADLVAEDRRVRDQVSQMEAGRLVVALGATDEEALRRNDLVFERLERARAAGEIGDFRSLHSLLWSADLQRRNRARVAASPRLAERTLSALAREGFRPEAFAQFGEALAAEDPGPLTWEALRRSALADLVRPFRATVDGQVAAFTFLRDVRDPGALAARLRGLDEVVYFDQIEFLGATYRTCRARTLELMGLGLVAVFLMIFVRYRRVGLSLAAFAPAILAAATSLALATWITGAPANLLHLVGLLLVLSMGEDYGVFVVESRRDRGELASTAVAVTMACATTVLSFGLLALSSNPALRAVGLTTGLGMVLSLLLAPTALLLLGDRRGGGGTPSTPGGGGR